MFFEALSQNIPSMRLKDIDFQPSTFTPSTYTPIDNSSSLLKLQENLFKQEQYGYAVGEKYVNFCKLLGDVYMMLYKDKDLITGQRIFPVGMMGKALTHIRHIE